MLTVTGVIIGMMAVPQMTLVMKLSWALESFLNDRDFLLANEDSIKFYNSLHSFGQMVTFIIFILLLTIVLVPRYYYHGGSVRHGQIPMMISTAWPC